MKIFFALTDPSGGVCTEYRIHHTLHSPGDGLDAVCTPALERAVAVGAAHLVAALAVVQLVGRQDATGGLISY